MSTPEVLRTWIESEFPHLQLPSEETLKALTSNSTTKELWLFLTSRARNVGNARAARAALSLSGEHYTRRAEQYERELKELRTTMQELETEIGELRAELEKDDVETGGISDVVYAAFDGRERGMRALIEELRSEEFEESDLEELLQFYGDVITEESLQAIEVGTTAISQRALLGVLQRRLGEAERRVVPVDVCGEDTQEVMERFAVDAALTAFKEFERLRGEHESGCERVLALVEGVGKEGFVRVLAAQLDGERAVSRYAKSREIVERPNGVKERDVSDVEHACGALCEGNLRLLADVCEVFENGNKFWNDVEMGVAEGVKAAEEMVTLKKRQGVGAVRGVCECDERKKEARRVDGLLGDVERSLAERCRVVQEARERVLERVDIDLVENGIREALQCRQIDAVRVRDELMAFVKQPGRSAAPWLR